MWDIARTPEEIANAYDKTFSPSEAAALPGLKGYWNLDDGTASDLSAYGNHGTLAGDASLVGSFEVYPANTTPTATPSITATVETGGTVDITLTATDADGDLVSFALPSEVSDTLGATLTLTDTDPTDNQATLSYTADAGVGADAVPFTVSDGISSSASEVVNVTVSFPANSAAAFPGNIDYVNFGADASLTLDDEFTIEAWIHPTGPGAQQDYSGTVVYKQGEYLLGRWDDGTINYALGNNWAWAATGYSVPDDVWAHIALVYSSAAGLVRVYANGVEVHSAAASGGIGDVFPANNDLWVGENEEWVGSAPESFEGDIDEVRIWNVARSAQQIANTYQKTITAAEAPGLPGLVGAWSFDDGTFNDATANGNDGTVTGAVVVQASQQAFADNGVPTADAVTAVSADTNATVNITLTGTDPDSDGLLFVIPSGVSDALGVTLTITDADPSDAQATVSYTAPATPGSDSFSFTVSDGITTSAAETVSVTVSLPANSSLVLDGVDDYVDIPADAALDVTSAATIELWFKTPVSLAAQPDFVSLARRVRTSGTNDDNYGILVGDGEYLRFLIGSDTVEQSVDTLAFTPALDTWYHVAGVFNTSVPELQVYINGVLNNTTPVTAPATAADGPLELGYTGPSLYFAGEIDEVRLWSVARTAEEIANAAAKTLTGVETGLEGYWNFDDATAGDLTVNGNGGTFLGGAGTGASDLTLPTNAAPIADTGITTSVVAGQTVVFDIEGKLDLKLAPYSAQVVEIGG